MTRVILRSPIVDEGERHNVTADPVENLVDRQRTVSRRPPIGGSNDSGEDGEIRDLCVDRRIFQMLQDIGSERVVRLKHFHGWTAGALTKPPKRHELVSCPSSDQQTKPSAKVTVQATLSPPTPTFPVCPSTQGPLRCEC